MDVLLGAHVFVANSSRGVATNNKGYYSLRGLPPGRYTIVASHIGFERFERTVTLAAGEQRRLDIVMEPVDLPAGELVVTGEQDEIEEEALGASRMPAGLIEQLPAVLEPDLFRALQLLPGVKASSDFSSGLHIRGGSPDQTLIQLDGAPVYNPSHFLGLFSTFNPDAINDVQLYSGAYPAAYGGRLGSVVDVTTSRGSRRKTEAGLSLGLLASRAYVEGPYAGADGQRANGSYSLAVRRSTLEPVLATLRGAVSEGIPNSFHFFDLNARVTYDPGPRDNLSLAVYGGNDVLDLRVLSDARFDVTYGNRTASFDWTHVLTDEVFSTVRVAGSMYDSGPVATIGGTAYAQENSVDDLSAEVGVEWLPTSMHQWSTGLRAGAIRLAVGGDELPSRQVRSEYASFFLQNVFRPTSSWNVKSGLRASYFSSGEFLRLQPRISVDYAVTPSLRLQTAYGRYVQYLTLESSELFSGFDRWYVTGDGVRPAYGDQYVAGFNLEPADNWELDVEAYYRTMHDLFQVDPFIPDRAGRPYAEIFRFGSGRAYGTEVLLKRPKGRLNGFVGYTLGRTERRFPGLNLGADGEAKFYPAKYDRTHSLNLVANYQITDGWTASAVFDVATGQPYTEPKYQYRIPDPYFVGSGDSRKVLVSSFNGSRLPLYHRLDLGVSHTGGVLDLANYEVRFQVINVYSQRNIWFYFYQFEKDGTLSRNAVPQIPVPIPHLSLSLTF